MARNIEIKLRCPDLDAVRRLAIAAGAESAGTLIQTDTFFVSTIGRLKLREIANDHAELIWYAREDIEGAKSSDYVVTPVIDADAMRNALASAIGVLKTVRKRRDLFLWRNVRIHLDAVESLGTFVELESVVGVVDESTATQHLQHLLGLLQLEQAERVAVAYADLLT